MNSTMNYRSYYNEQYKNRRLKKTDNNKLVSEKKRAISNESP